MNVRFYVDHLTVPLSNQPLKTNNDAGSEINFFREAPTGDWKFFFIHQMEKCHQKVSINFFLAAKHKPKFLVTLWEILVANFSFTCKNQTEENGFGATMMIFH